MSSTETLATTHEETELGTAGEPQQTGVSEAGHDHAQDPAQPGPAFNPECTRDVEVTIPAAEVGGAFRRVVKNYTRQARIPGFRAGKVPERLIRARFDEQIRQDVVEQLLPDHFRAEIGNRGLQPISQPQVTELELEDGKPLRFKAIFEVMPEVAMDGWQEIRVNRETAELTDAELDAEVERARDSRSTMEPVTEDRELADGDFAEIRFSGTVTAGEAIAEPIVGDQIPLEVGGRNTLPAFSDALRGARVGQELKLEVEYPAEFGEARLAGRTIAYDVEVLAIKHRNAPELDDAFAQSLGPYETMDEFRTKLREHLTADKQRQAEAATKDRILETLAERYVFPIPETLVAAQIDARLDRGLRALAQQGMTQEQMRQLDFGRLRAGQREGAIGEVQGTMLLDQVARLEGVQAEPAELDRELEMLAVQTREPVDALRARLQKDGSIPRIEEQIRREKAGRLIYDKLSH